MSRTALLLLALGVLMLPAVAQESPAVRFRALLSHVGEPLGDCEVRLEFRDGSGSAQVLQLRSDASGHIDADLGRPAAGSHFVVRALRGDDKFDSIPIAADGNVPGAIELHPVAADAAAVRQRAMRIVSVNENVVTGAKNIHVRQICFVNNSGAGIYYGDRDAGGGALPTLWFPVPEGAQLESLLVDQQPVPDETIRQHPTLGFSGVAIEHALYPLEERRDATVEGTFTIAVAPGETVSLEYVASLLTESYVLALERQWFRLLDGDGPALTPGGQMNIRSRVNEIFQSGEIAAGERQAARLVFEERSRITIKLFDASLYIVQSHGGQQGAEEVPLGGSSVVIQSLEGQGEPVTGETDAEGKLEIDLARLPGDEIVIKGLQGDHTYFSMPVSKGTIGASVAMFRTNTSGAGIEQSISRIVTENENFVTGEKNVQVRQIVAIRNSSFEVWVGKPEEQGSDRFGATYVFPVPEGAQVTSLVLMRSGERGPVREDVDDTTPRRDPVWGTYGVPIRNAMYPTQASSVLQLMGTFNLSMRPGAEVDLGVPADLGLHDFTLALENRRFHLVDGSGLEDQGPIEVPNVQKLVNGWGTRDVAAGTPLPATVRWADPGLGWAVWRNTLLWTAGLVVAIYIGLVLARRSTPTRSASEDFLVALEAAESPRPGPQAGPRPSDSAPESGESHADGGQSGSLPEAATVDAGTIPPEVLSSLQRLFEKGGDSPDVAAKLAHLGDVLRDHLGDEEQRDPPAS